MALMDKLLGSTNSLEKGLDAYWLRNQVIANNIANYETPGFKTSRVEFEEEFKSALESGGAFETKTTRSKHIKFSTPDFSAKVLANPDYSTRLDGNNVDIEYEMNEQAKNNIAYNVAVQKLNKQLGRIKLAITGR